MESNKFDKNIKVKMEARTIAPSADAWGKLEAMMSVADKPKRKYVWWYIAASFVGLLLVSSIFFNQSISNKINTSNSVVLEQVQTSSSLEESAISNEEDALPQKGSRDIVHKKREAKGIKSTISSDVMRASERVRKQKNQVVLYANPIVKVSIINQKSSKHLEELVSSEVPVVENLTPNDLTFANEKPVSQTRSVHVNATRLLSQVDQELELTFREKVINKISRNYQSVKVALENRNLE
ncbi:hypothetical protein HNQ02_000329 [Flavobacterium sp. 7E]|uniref:hypothetical protein n=1 Tax=Flavobacterium sp. 7E TaxID=2735898 RepID=UPI00156F33B3|nr:hypothetical protein [Flavobacterium sp. 7E]NRS87429.1 hypothetical protein [Flavobacterium sp. 7E]